MSALVAPAPLSGSLPVEISDKHWNEWAQEYYGGDYPNGGHWSGDPVHPKGLGRPMWTAPIWMAGGSRN